MHVHREYRFSPILSMREILEAIRISSQPIAVFAQVDPLLNSGLTRQWAGEKKIRRLPGLPWEEIWSRRPSQTDCVELAR